MKFFAVPLSLLLASNLFAGEDKGEPKGAQKSQCTVLADVFCSDSAFAPIAAFLSDDALHNLCRISSCFAPNGHVDASIVKYCFRDARVQLADNLADNSLSWYNWAVVRKNPEKIAKITAVQNSHVLALDPNFPEEKWHLLWSKEVIGAASTGTEPAYLRSFSKKIGENLLSLERPATLEATQKLALKILLAMNVYNYTARHIAADIAWRSASQAKSAAAMNTAWYTAANAAWQAARGLGEDVVIEVIIEAADKLVWNWSDFRNAVMNALRAEGVAVDQPLRLSFRVAEVAAHIYHLRHFDEILSVTFQELEKQEFASASNVFASADAWERFKERYFGKLKPEARHFLQPWLDAIERLMFGR